MLPGGVTQPLRLGGHWPLLGNPRGGGKDRPSQHSSPVGKDKGWYGAWPEVRALFTHRNQMASGLCARGPLSAGGMGILGFRGSLGPPRPCCLLWDALRRRVRQGDQLPLSHPRGQTAPRSQETQGAWRCQAVTAGGSLASLPLDSGRFWHFQRQRCCVSAAKPAPSLTRPSFQVNKEPIEGSPFSSRAHLLSPSRCKGTGGARAGP